VRKRKGGNRETDGEISERMESRPPDITARHPWSWCQREHISPDEPIDLAPANSDDQKAKSPEDQSARGERPPQSLLFAVFAGFLLAWRHKSQVEWGWETNRRTAKKKAVGGTEEEAKEGVKEGSHPAERPLICWLADDLLHRDGPRRPTPPLGPSPLS
jgi:hypothetical protein